MYLTCTYMRRVGVSQKVDEGESCETSTFPSPLPHTGSPRISPYLVLDISDSFPAERYQIFVWG